MDRREFLWKVGGAALGLGLAGSCARKGGIAGEAGAASAATASGSPASAVVVRARGTDFAAMTRATVNALGGMEKYVRHGSKVVIKPNVGWDRPFDVRANTHPEIVRAAVVMAQRAGAAEIKIVDYAVDYSKKSFEVSGIAKVAEETGVEAIPVAGFDTFTEVTLPEGKILKSAKVIPAVAKADVIINIPIAKSHFVTAYTGALKNWMGIVQDRDFFHGHDIDQCIVDIQRRFPATLVIMDATAIMLTGGPGGPGQLKQTNEILATLDPVAVDSYSLGLFGGIELQSVAHIGRAAQAGLGCNDLSKIEIRDVA